MIRPPPTTAAVLVAAATMMACEPAPESTTPQGETSTTLEGEPMEYVIRTENLEPQPTLSIRDPVAVDEIAAAIGERTGRVWQHLQELGSQPVGPPFTRYHEFGAEEVDLEVGFPVARRLEGEGEIAAGRLPGGEVIVTVHRGPYEGLDDAGAALDRWLEENDREARGPNWEVYRVNAGMVNDPAEYETDVYKPIR